jgi:pimeloyl-ACP methyl ester carboxylesterase
VLRVVGRRALPRRARWSSRSAVVYRKPVVIERGLAGKIPFAAVGSGSPIVVSAGLSPATGVDSDRFVRGALAPLHQLAARRLLIVLNRRRELPADVSMSDLAAEYAEAIRAVCDPPVDVLGISTGGSIAQQLAAEHPDTVRRLVLLSTACRLGPAGRDLSRRIAALLRAGRTRSALGVVCASLAPPGLRTLARGVGWAAAGRLIADPVAAADLAATLEAEDGFDLARCEPIEATTLLIAGGRDRFYSPDLFTATAALIPNSQLRLFPRRGHITVATDRRARATAVGFLG